MTLGGKWETKINDNPGIGDYDVEAAHNAVLPKVKFTAIMKPDLKLYTKPESIRPEVNDDHHKPMGAECKGHITMGFKYETKIVRHPSPIGIDHDALMDATKPRVKGMHGFGGGPVSAFERPSPSKLSSTPSAKQIKGMSREEKIALL